VLCQRGSPNITDQGQIKHYSVNRKNIIQLCFIFTITTYLDLLRILDGTNVTTMLQTIYFRSIVIADKVMGYDRESLLFVFFYFLVLHPVARTTTIFNESTTFRNQTMRVLFIIYAALHVSAYKQAIFKCYLTILQRSSYWIFTPWIHWVTLLYYCSRVFYIYIFVSQTYKHLLSTPTVLFSRYWAFLFLKVKPTGALKGPYISAFPRSRN
jgi:hypothetical protein